MNKILHTTNLKYDFLLCVLIISTQINAQRLVVSPIRSIPICSDKALIINLSSISDSQGTIKTVVTNSDENKISLYNLVNDKLKLDTIIIPPENLFLSNQLKVFPKPGGKLQIISTVEQNYLLLLASIIVTNKKVESFSTIKGTEMLFDPKFVPFGNTTLVAYFKVCENKYSFDFYSYWTLFVRKETIAKCFVAELVNNKISNPIKLQDDGPYYTQNGPLFSNCSGKLFSFWSDTKGIGRNGLNVRATYFDGKKSRKPILLWKRDSVTIFEPLILTSNSNFVSAIWQSHAYGKSWDDNIIYFCRIDKELNIINNLDSLPKGSTIRDAYLDNSNRLHCLTFDNYIVIKENGERISAPIKDPEYVTMLSDVDIVPINDTTNYVFSLSINKSTKEWCISYYSVHLVKGQ